MVRISFDRELLTAEVFGYDGTFECPGGGGGNDAFFLQDTKEYIHHKIEQRTKDIHNLENKLERVREAIRVRNIGSISFEKGQQ